MGKVAQKYGLVPPDEPRRTYATKGRLALSRAEAAQAIGVGIATLDRAIRAGQLRATKGATRVFITPAALVEFVGE